MGGIVQEYNAELVDGLRPIFQARYEPNFAWSTVCAQHLALTGLRGFWPMSAFDDTGDAYDQSGNSRLLTLIDDTIYGYDDLAPYVQFDGSLDWLLRADEAGLDITGTETYVDATYRGLTMGCWCYPQDSGSLEYLMSKWLLNNDRSYAIQITAADNFRAVITTDGSTVVSQAHVGTLRSANEWFHVVMRFDPSTSLDIYVNGEKESNLVGIPASIFSGAADFYVAAKDPGDTEYEGRVSLAFLCASALSDAHIFALFQQSRALFGV